MRRRLFLTSLRITVIVEDERGGHVWLNDFLDKLNIDGVVVKHRQPLLRIKVDRHEKGPLVGFVNSSAAANV